METKEIVGLEGPLGHVKMGEHGTSKWYQQGGKMQCTETKATTYDSVSRTKK